MPTSAPRLATPADFDALMALRYRVFCDEQGVPRDIERDDEDAVALHLIASSEGRAVATGRLLRQRIDHACVAPSDQARPGDLARIGRMAVDASVRGQGIGAAVLTLLESEARRVGLDTATLHAQWHARGFYAKAGYIPFGEPFDEAGIRHIEMRKALSRG